MQGSNVAAQSFSTPLCEIKENKQTASLRLHVSQNTDKSGKMKEIKSVSPNLERLDGVYKESKGRNNSKVPEGMTFCSLQPL